MLPSERIFVNLFEGLVTQILSNPQVFEDLSKFLFSSNCHNAVDVAQDALDAYDHGHLTREQALEIVQICLQNPTIDIKSKRVEIEKLFNS